MSLTMAYHHIKIVIQEHCLAKKVTKDFKRFDNMFISYLCKDVGQMPEWGCGAHNRAHQSEKTHYSCKSKGNKFHSLRSRFNPDIPWPRQKKHKYKYYKKISYLKKKQKPTTDSTCFNCKKKYHWAHQFPRKKNKPNLSALFSEELDLKW
jgi:hypothetical protein